MRSPTPEAAIAGAAVGMAHEEDGAADAVQRALHRSTSSSNESRPY
jgi:hypothetical protein